MSFLNTRNEMMFLNSDGGIDDDSLNSNLIALQESRKIVQQQQSVIKSNYDQLRSKYGSAMDVNLKDELKSKTFEVEKLKTQLVDMKQRHKKETDLYTQYKNEAIGYCALTGATLERKGNIIYGCITNEEKKREKVVMYDACDPNVSNQLRDDLKSVHT